LAEVGANVVLAARSTEQIASVARQVERVGTKSLAITTDVTKSDDIDAMVEAAITQFGRIDILVNNSGVVSSRELLDTTESEWSRVLDTNLGGVFLATRAVGKHLVAQGSGKVVNIASNFAIRGIARHAAYGASKAAVVAFTKCMAVEWARHNVQVNGLAPGYFSTDLNAAVRGDPAMMERILRAVPARRMGDASELAPWVVLLSSSASDFMTGETIVIDGGQSI
jgi:2-deoxy-D-gluconate 3-dehydrogenase